MLAQSNQCDQHRLTLLLADQLSEAEQVAVARHLESCQTCRWELEQSAGDQRWWDEASEFLRPRGDDLAGD